MNDIELVDKAKVLEIVSTYCPDDDGSCSKADADPREMLDEIEALSSIAAEPVKHGEWEDVKFSEGVYKDNDDSNDIGLSITSAKCSLCQRYSERLQQYSPKMPAYCSHCGAKMDGGENE